MVLFLASHKDITKRKISGEIPEQDVGMKVEPEQEPLQMNLVPLHFVKMFIFSYQSCLDLGKGVERVGNNRI